MYDPVRHRRVWLTVAVLVIGCGSIASILGARALARNDAQQSHQALVNSATEIASTLTLDLEHVRDLSVNGAEIALSNSTPSQADFLQWTKANGIFAQNPELQGISEYVMVPASGLGAFAAHAAADPAGTLANHGTFQVAPAGNRSYYCLISLSATRAGGLPVPAGLDLCDTELGPALLGIRDSGRSGALAYRSGKVQMLVVGTPIYNGGTTPTTVQARRDAFVGWMFLTTVPHVVLASAVVDHAGLAVALRYHVGTFNTAFLVGTPAVHAKSTTTDLYNGWRVQTYGAVASGGMLSNDNSLVLLLGGLLVSLLVGALIFVLGTGRSRALALANTRTGELLHQAFHDSLTGLPNRALILDRTGQMLARSRRELTAVAVLFLDIDNFKAINDTLGHSAGDELLMAVGARLASTVRGEDTVGRMGGDEFVLVVEGEALAAGPMVVAERILDVLGLPFEIAGSETPLTISASIGIAEGRRDAPDELIRDADIALYEAKAAGKKCAVVFSASMQDAVDHHRSLEVDLQIAVANHQFFLLYQPTINLVTGTITGVEALLRWRHPERGVVCPDDFIPALESSGLIVPVGRWVLEEACRQGAAWHRQGHSFVVSVNVSAKQLDRDGIVDDVRGALTATGFDPNMLVLELTETTLMHHGEATVARLTLLKALGLRLAIDDFGTGYSSMAYLRKFPIDVLKIDRAFVSEIADSPDAAALLHTLVQLGKTLRLETIAEGVENEDQCRHLAAENVDVAQGFLFARPLDVEAVGCFVEDLVHNPLILLPSPYAGSILY
jgi:diguanylate cyclase (GGDEF)-like protein